MECDYLGEGGEIGQLLTVSDVSTTCTIIIISIIMTEGDLPTVHRHVHRNAIHCQQLFNQLRDFESRLRETAKVDVYHVAKFSLSFVVFYYELLLQNVW